MQKWCQHHKMAASCNFRVVEDDLKLFCDIYIMLCHVSDPNLRGGGGGVCFFPKWAVDSSYSWTVHCFQIKWRIRHSVGIGLKGSSRNWVNAAMNPVSIVAGWSQRQKQTKWLYTAAHTTKTATASSSPGFTYYSFPLQCGIKVNPFFNIVIVNKSIFPNW